jgi:hypothetical protein
VSTLKRSTQQAHMDTMVAVVQDGPEIQERKAWASNLAHKITHFPFGRVRKMK